MNDSTHGPNFKGTPPILCVVMITTDNIILRSRVKLTFVFNEKNMDAEQWGLAIASYSMIQYTRFSLPSIILCYVGKNIDQSLYNTKLFIFAPPQICSRLQ